MELDLGVDLVLDQVWVDQASKQASSRQASPKQASSKQASPMTMASPIQTLHPEQKEESCLFQYDKRRLFMCEREGLKIVWCEPVCLFELTLLDLLLLDASHPLDHSALLPLLDFEEHHLTPLPDLVFPHESPFEALEDDASQSSASGAAQLLVAGGPHLGLGALQVVAGGLQVFLGSLQLFPHPPDSGCLGGAFVVVTGLGGG